MIFGWFASLAQNMIQNSQRNMQDLRALVVQTEQSLTGIVTDIHQSIRSETKVAMTKGIEEEVKTFDKHLKQTTDELKAMVQALLKEKKPPQVRQKF